MERDANYVAVGAFVIVVLAMATVFVLWYTNAQERREYQRYEVYFSGSVNGLSEGSTVRYLGVNVGRVARIRLDPRAADRVEALIDVDKSTPVTANTEARLTMQGVTGLLFIDLSQATRPSSLPGVPSQDFPVIRSAPSDLDLFLSGLPELVADANRVTRRLNAVLSDDNLAAIHGSLANLQRATESLPAVAQSALDTARELHAASSEAREVAANVNRLLAEAGPSLGSSAVKLQETADRLATLTGRVDALVARHQEDLDQFAGPGLAELSGLLRESRDAATQVRELARGLREDPSKLLYQPAPAGVEIPR